MLRQLSLFLVGSVLAAAAGLAGAQSSGDYAEDLARLYAGHQRVLALRQACEESYPGQRSIYEKAYGEWNTRHRALLQELEQRLTGMLRRASKDQQEYSRNLGKYEGAILQQRLEYKQTLLALDKADLEQQCRQLPDYLASPDADFRKKYAQELQTLGKRKP